MIRLSKFSGYTENRWIVLYRIVSAFWHLVKMTFCAPFAVPWTFFQLRAHRRRYAKTMFECYERFNELDKVSDFK